MEETKSTKLNVNRGIVEYIVLGAFLFIIYLSSLYNFLLFHTIAELFSIVIAGGIFIIGWNSRKYTKSSFFLVIGTAFLFIGTIDLLHTLAYSGMGIFIEYDANLPTQLWIAGRYMQAFSFLFAILSIDRKVSANYLFMAYTIITVILLYIIFNRIFPDCFIEGSGLTPFKIYSEYVIDIILLTCIALMIKFRDQFNKNIFIFTIIAIISTMISEIAFTFYVSVYGFSNLVGHVFKIIAFFFAYKGIIQVGLKNPFDSMFR